MKKRILSFMLALAMLVPAVAVVSSAIPYTPSTNAYKDFGQENYYLYEVTKGNAAPKADGKITEADGYGKPISTYGFRYVTTADKAAFDADKGEYVMNSTGDYYVYPTPESDPAIWTSITNFEADNTLAYLLMSYVVSTKFSSSSTYYFINPITRAYTRAYGVTKATFTEYRPMNANLEYTLVNPTVLTEKPADWETNYTNYYIKKTSSGYLYVEGETAPEWEASKYYTGEYFTVSQLYTRPSEGTASSPGTVTTLKNAHAILPEELNLYARYDDKYLYYAIESKEMKHEVARYGMSNWYYSTITNTPVHLYNNMSFISYYRMAVDSTTPTATAGTGLTTYTNVKQTIKSAYLPAVLAKFGNPQATTLEEVQTAGTDYAISHTPYKPSQETTPSDDPFAESTEDFSSKKYGTTVYEYRVPWAVINREYSPDKSASAVMDVFSLRCFMEVENGIGDGAVSLVFGFPRAAYRLPGSIYTTTGPYPKDVHVMRNPNNVGMPTGSSNFYWKTVGNSTNYYPWGFEYFSTDYFTISDKKSGTLAHFPPIFYTMGQEPSEEYVAPLFEGATFRVDGSDAQQLRVKISIPETEKEIEQAGILLAPTEVSRRGHLELGMSAIAYYEEEYPVFYGIFDGKWVNMTENADAYFGAVATPNDSDSYVTMEPSGGKPTGVYTVFTLPVDLEDPYGQATDEEGNSRDVYTTIYTGPNGEGIYDDYDDFFTFYTIRPFIKYADGTVVYGEYEYKSIYYLACWTIADMLYAYNETVVDSATASDHYNMDMMYLATVKDAEGNIVTDYDGNNIYIPISTTSLTVDSIYAGGAENSIYWPERRLELFRWFANRTVSRANGGVSIRIEDYENYHPDVKALVDGYVELYENIWNLIVNCEQKQYFTAK